MPFRLFCVGIVALVVQTALGAHDLFFRASDYRLVPHSETTIDVLNGTFSTSENAITRDRLVDVSLVTPAATIAIDRDRWSERDPKSTVRVAVGGEGTYVLGAAIAPRLLSLSGHEFNAYLREEGLTDILARRAGQSRLDEPSRERYSKFVKALLQVGANTTSTYATPLGYAAEIIPEQNPYALTPGDQLTVRCLVDGQPWKRGAVFAGGRQLDGVRRIPQQRFITDGNGRATARLTQAGSWYVKFVAMAEVSGVEANYESKWSTLSFGVHRAPSR